MMKFFVLAASVSASGTLSNASLSIADLYAGATSATTIKFTTAGTALAAANTIVITYPVGFGVSATPLVTATGIKIDAPVGDADAKTVTLTVATSGGQAAAGEITLVVTEGITNPTTLDTTGQFKLGVGNGSDVQLFDGVKISAETGDLDKGADCVVTATVKAEKCKHAFFCETRVSAPASKCTDRIAAEAPCTQNGSCVKDYICKGPDGSKKCTSGAFSYGFTMLAVLAAFFL